MRRFSAKASIVGSTPFTITVITTITTSVMTGLHVGILTDVYSRTSLIVIKCSSRFVLMSVLAIGAYDVLLPILKVLERESLLARQ